MSFISSLEPSQASGANQTWTFCGWNSVYLWPNLASWLWAWKLRWGSLDIRSVLPDKPLIGSNMNTTWRLTCCQNLLGPTHRNKYMVPGSVHFECCLPHPGRQYLRFLPDTVEIGSSHLPLLINIAMGFYKGYLTIQLNEDLGETWTFALNQGQIR